MPRLDRFAHPPAPAVTELDRLPPWVLGSETLVPALVPSLRLDIRSLRRLRELMDKLGEPVEVHRMRYDRRYAADRIGVALAAPQPALRRLALMLLEQYTGPLRHR